MKNNNLLTLASQFLSQYPLEVHHIPGAFNVLADSLSRLPSHAVAEAGKGELDQLELSLQGKERRCCKPSSQTALLCFETVVFNAREWNGRPRPHHSPARCLWSGVRTSREWWSICEP
ncbi:hypothetical protein XA68_12144 [Ophiocordyceps unilateralis]|uniref:Reverse transcriptase RNase H-like domain-containing protein n=1 Tax=Ophiocordyceps unilateralis TaxID=268505 RepID=A0A2A9PFG7_OPHUN|nr:hypothetical protein XA68_12144 [Ophiocordyceps unilateralis]